MRQVLAGRVGLEPVELGVALEGVEGAVDVVGLAAQQVRRVVRVVVGAVARSTIWPNMLGELLRSP